MGVNLHQALPCLADMRLVRPTQFRAGLQASIGAAASEATERQPADTEGQPVRPPQPGPEDLARASAVCDRLVHETEGLVLEALEVGHQLTAMPSSFIVVRPSQCYLVSGT